MTKNDAHDQDVPEVPAPGAEAPAATVATIDRFTPADLELLLAPHTITPAQWIRSLMLSEELPEGDAESMTLGMLASILMAESSEEALAALELARAKELCGGEPGGMSPVLQITGARALRSTYEEGAVCYAIISAFQLDSGEEIRFTTGARAVQMVVAKHCYEGWLPFKARLQIRRERTQAGYHPLNLIGGI